MSRSHDISSPDYLKRYLLGHLAEAEQEAVEDIIFTDTEYHERVSGAEDELFFAYARGKLTGEDSRRFEERFLGDAEGRNRLRLAQGLHQLSAASRRSFVDWIAAPVPRWSMAAAVVVVATIAVTGAMNVRSRLTREVREERARAENLDHELATLRSLQAVPVFLRLSVESRDVRSSAQGRPAPRLELSSERPTIVSLQPVLPENAPAPPYRAVVEAIGGALPVWSERLDPAQKEVIVRIPSQALQTGDYLLTLQSSTIPESGFRPHYSFSVLKR